MLGVQKKIMGNVKMITRYRTFDIKINDSGKLVVSFDSHLLSRTPYEFEPQFESVSEAMDDIDQYWRKEARRFSEGMLN
jgi:predicted nucleotidyltransferase